MGTSTGSGYAGSAGPGKTLLPSLVIDASVGAKHMFGKKRSTLENGRAQNQQATRDARRFSFFASLLGFQIDATGMCNTIERSVTGSKSVMQNKDVGAAGVVHLG